MESDEVSSDGFHEDTSDDSIVIILDIDSQDFPDDDGVDDGSIVTSSNDLSTKSIPEVTRKRPKRKACPKSKQPEKSSKRLKLQSIIKTEKKNPDGATEDDKLKDSRPLFDGKFFSPVSKYNDVSKNNRLIKKMKAKCHLCTLDTFITSSTDSSYNFLRHLKVKHGNHAYQEYFEYKEKCNESKLEQKKMNQIKIEQDILAKACGIKQSPDESVSEFKANQQTVDQYSTNSSPSPRRTHNKRKFTELFETQLVKFVAAGCHNLSIVDEKEFKALLQLMFNYLPFKFDMFSSHTLTRRILDNHEKSILRITDSLSTARYLCLTADTWSSKERSVFGCTAHWLNSDTFEQNMAVLCCSRVEGTLNFIKIAELLHELMTTFKIDVKKVSGTVTNNASNLVKSFKDFGVHIIHTSEMPEDGETDEEFSQFDIIDLDVDWKDGDEYAMSEAINDANLQACELPPHFRGSAHTLSLLITTDFKKMLDLPGSVAIKRLHFVALRKCNELWKKGSKPKTGQIIESIFGKKLRCPGATHWNSLYDALQVVVNFEKDMPKLSKQLGVTCLTTMELNYLKTYILVMRPIADTLEKLQGRVVYGSLLPALFSLEIKLQILIKDIKNCSTIDLFRNLMIKQMIIHLKRRFKQFFELDTKSSDVVAAVLASISCPHFKLRWIPENCKLKMKTLFVDVCKKQQLDGNEEMNSPSPQHNDVDDNFFICLSGPSSSSGDNSGVDVDHCSSIDLETSAFLQDSRKNIEMLSDYRVVKYVYLKYNILNPSSAEIERIFSTATHVLDPKRPKLNDDIFEALVMLKYNYNYV